MEDAAKAREISEELFSRRCDFYVAKARVHYMHVVVASTTYLGGVTSCAELREEDSQYFKLCPGPVARRAILEDASDAARIQYIELRDSRDFSDDFELSEDTTHELCHSFVAKLDALSSTWLFVYD
jgi:hypothetical protein